MPTTRKRDRRGYTPPTRADKIHIGAFFPSEVHAAIREVARRKKVAIKDLVAEAIGDVLRKHGKTPPPNLSAG
jgi:hypothetical protein